MAVVGALGRVRCLFLLCAPGLARSLQFATFDDAAASSVFGDASSGGGGRFGPSEALSTGNGYFCSAGAPDEVVTWTGTVSARRKVLGVRLGWAYSPGEFKIVSSGDGANFELLADWRRPSSADVAFTENVMFGAPVGVKTFTLVMRRPRPWKFFGLASIELIVEPGPVLLVSGATAHGGFQCVVDAGAGGANVRPCADAIADGSGGEVFESTADGMLRTVANKGRCLILSDGSGSLTVGACEKHGETNPAGVFEVNGASQLVLPRKGKCIVLRGGAGGPASILSRAEVRASSSQPAHPISNVVDDTSSTYWAASFASEPVDVTLSFGAAPAKVASISLDFEYPPKRFQVDVSNQGPWRTVFAAGANNLNETSVDVGGAAVANIRVRLLEPHPVWGVAGGNSVVGIRAVRVDASDATLVARDCADASGAADAGDKFFMVAVPGYSAAPSAAAKDAASLARAAGNRLSGLVAALETRRPLLSTCAFAGRSGGDLGTLREKSNARRSSASRARGDRVALDAIISAAQEEVANIGGALD